MECCNLRYIGKNPIDLRTDEVTTVNQEQNIVVKDVAINGNVKDLVKDRGIFNSKSLTGTDYNTITKQGVYSIPLSGSTNGPGYAAKLLVYSVFESPLVTQVAIDVGSVAIKCRYKSDTVNWTPWETVIFNTDTATTSKAGIVQLNNTVTSTSTTQAATANAVKMAYDKAVEASESIGRSETADKLTTARTIQTNLASTASASFDGTKNVTPGVTGVLPVANGGTGRTDGKAPSLVTARTIGITGVVTGTATAFDGSKNITIDTTTLNFEDSGVTGELPIAHGGTGRTDGKAVALVTDRTISLTGAVTGSTTFDGSKNVSISTQIGSISGTVPIGGIIAFSGTFGGTGNRYPIPLGSTTPDTQWCLCDGTTTNGKAVPNLRGRMILGASTSHPAGTKGGSETHTHSISGTVGAHTLTVAQIPAHNHTFTSSKGDKDYNNGDSNTWWGWNSNRTTTTTVVGSTQSHTHDFSKTSTTNKTLLPPYYALSYIMRIS